jgi:hypothetical protein
MSISSIGSNDLGWQNAGPATRRAASGSEPNRTEANTAQVASETWEGFQEDVRSQLEPTDYSITFTSTTTFSTLA